MKILHPVRFSKKLLLSSRENLEKFEIQDTWILWILWILEAYVILVLQSKVRL